jgi:hypothetical protein
MAYRQPTYEEIRARVSRARFWIGAGMYALIGLGGAQVFGRFVRDPQWLEIIASFWWVPSGLAAMWVAWWITDWIVRWVPEEPQQPF